MLSGSGVKILKGYEIPCFIAFSTFREVMKYQAGSKENFCFGIETLRKEGLGLGTY